MKHSIGFHLIELMIVIAIMGILVSISVSVYTHHVVFSRRVAAEMALTELSLRMEAYYLKHQTYQNATLRTLQFPVETGHHDYHLQIETSDNQYVLKAEPIGLQSTRDKACGALLLYDNGKKGVAGYAKNETCWSF